jgi:hypothetical protein
VPDFALHIVKRMGGRHVSAEELLSSSDQTPVPVADWSFATHGETYAFLIENHNNSRNSQGS